MSDVPVASATPRGLGGPSVRAQARAIVEETLRDVNLGGMWRTIRADARESWLATTTPPTLSYWAKSTKPDMDRVPGGSPAIYGAWRVDNLTTGGLLAGLSILLFLGAAGIRWCAAHPVRRWALLLTVVTTTAALLIL